MADYERPDSRPKCGYKINVQNADGSTSTDRVPCNSEQDLWKVTGRGKWSNGTRITDVCQKHYEKNVMKEWKVEGAEKYGSAPK